MFFLWKAEMEKVSFLKWHASTGYKHTWLYFMRCFPSGAWRTMTRKAPAAATLVLPPSDFSPPGPLWRYRVKALLQSSATSKATHEKVTLGEKSGDGGGEKAEVEAAPQQLCCPGKPLVSPAKSALPINFWLLLVCTSCHVLPLTGRERAVFQFLIVWFCFSHKEKSMSKKKRRGTIIKEDGFLQQPAINQQSWPCLW